MSTDLLGELEQNQKNLLTYLGSVPVDDSYRQYRDDLSPIAWHIGHCAFIEEYWIQEVIGGDSAITEPLKELYFPELSQKKTRSDRLPSPSDLTKFATDLFVAHLEKLNELANQNHSHRLLKNNYLLRFLLQHSSQHQETIEQTLYQRALKMNWDFQTQHELGPVDHCAPRLEFDSSESEFGNSNAAEAYDNERPITRHALSAFRISQRSANNAEFLGFMKSNGYQRESFWSQEGWQWLQREKVDSPEHWQKDSNHNWTAITSSGAQDLQPNDAVYGLNQYEAQAFAHYVGGRLPHEFEWEYAAELHASPSEQAWDWCGNSFFPYPNFRAYPYDRYSKPWFDGSHYTLRGASIHTGRAIRRISFRNFYTPEKRHVFAGVRVAFDC